MDHLTATVCIVGIISLLLFLLWVPQYIIQFKHGRETRENMPPNWKAERILAKNEAKIAYMKAKHELDKQKKALEKLRDE